MYRFFIKRSIDFIGSVFLLIILSPFFLVISLILMLSNKGTPFFVQARPGKKEKTIHVLKFKTMNDNKDSNNKLLPDSERLTIIGKFIRKTSLDELPQLINVLKGNMSFIGPRPLLIKYLPYYTEEEKIRHSVRPGITGLAQVSGRNLLNWDTRLEKDIIYVNNLSFFLDLKIIFITIKNVLTSKDVVVDPNSVIQDLDESRKKN